MMASSRKPWRASRDGSRPDHVHAWPVGDLIEHDIDGDGCVCGPTVQYVAPERDDQGDGWVLTHHSLDGREALE